MVEGPSGGGKRCGAAASAAGDSIRSAKKAPNTEWKVCKGCLYYSSRLRAEGRGPPCLGKELALTRVLPPVREQYEIKATREGSLSYFQYGCVGLSVFGHDKGSSSEKREKQTRLPVCAGYELLVARRTAFASKAPANVHQKGDLLVRYQARALKLGRKGFFSRFTRNAGVVASGVAKNLLRAGIYIKDNIDDVLYPDRRRPK